MASVLNGLALYGQFRVFGATFLIFFRLYAAQHAPCRFNETARNLYSHTRLTLCGRRWANSPTGGDNRVSAAHSQFECFRPADAEETAWSWVEAMKRLDGPSALILTRQGLPMLAKPEAGISPKALILSGKSKKSWLLSWLLQAARLTLLCGRRMKWKTGLGRTGSIGTQPRGGVFAAGRKISQQNYTTPDTHFSSGTRSGRRLVRHQSAGGRVDVFSLERFGASGPGGQEVVEHLGFTIEALKKRIKKTGEIVKMKGLPMGSLFPWCAKAPGSYPQSVIGQWEVAVAWFFRLP